MAGDLDNTLAGNISIVTGENVKPNYHGNSQDPDSFLLKVVAPIYKLIEKVRHCRISFRGFEYSIKCSGQLTCFYFRNSIVLIQKILVILHGVTMTILMSISGILRNLLLITIFSYKML